MPTGRVWMYRPHSGGKKIPEHVRLSTQRRIEAFAGEHFAGRYGDLAVRFRGQFCYIDARSLAGGFDRARRRDGRGVPGSAAGHARPPLPAPLQR